MLVQSNVRTAQQRVLKYEYVVFFSYYEWEKRSYNTQQAVVTDALDSGSLMSLYTFLPAVFLSACN